jgi:hypothetical protein
MIPQYDLLDWIFTCNIIYISQKTPWKKVKEDLFLQHLSKTQQAYKVAKSKVPEDDTVFPPCITLTKPLFI